MRTLTLTTDTFDQVNTFMIQGPRRAIRACLHRDFEKQGDGIYWAMQKSGMLKSTYTEADRAETDRLNSEPVIQNGEIVLIDGEQYKIRVNGDYSDCAMFDKI